MSEPWRVHWDSIPADGAATADPLDLDEDLYMARQGQDGAVIDVGWYPSGDPAGGFKCMRVRNPARPEDWHSPAGVLRTREVAEVRAWIAAEMAK